MRARNDDLPLARNPLDWALGKAIRGLREERDLEPEAFAKLLGISASYERAIEGGRATLPPDCGRSLVWTLGANFAAVSGLLVLAKALDQRKDRLPDLAATKDVAIELLKAERERAGRGDPQLPIELQELLEQVVDALEVSLTPGPNEDRIEAAVVDMAKRISEWLRGKPLGKVKPSLRVKDKRSFGERFKLSPVFEDLIEGFAARLALFSPRTTSFEFEKWESANAPRICEVHAFQSDPSGFVDIAGKYGWEFLWNRHKPDVYIYTLPEHASSIGQLQHRLRRIIAGLTSTKRDRRDSKVHLRVIPERLERKCTDGLKFDSARPEEPPLAKDETVVRDEGAAYDVFKNVWLYKLKPDIFASDSEQLVYRIGFLDTYQGQLRSAHAVAISYAHVKYWDSIFNEATSKN